MSGGPATLSEVTPPSTSSPVSTSTPSAPPAGTPDVSGLSAREMKEKITNEKEVSQNPRKGSRVPITTEKQVEKVETVDPSKETPAPAPETVPWYKKAGFEDEETGLKSVASAQEKIRQQSEELKNYKREEQAKVQEELTRLRKIEADRNLTPEEKHQRETFQKWEKDNADALKLIEGRLLGKLEQEYDIQPKARKYEEQVMSERNEWKKKFDADKSRAELWPIMDSLYKEQDIFESFQRNPLPYVEAMAFQKNFTNIAERIGQDAVERYKAEIKKAEEAERRNKTGIPGGAKVTGGNTDVGSMSSRELGNLLPRNENG